MGEVTLTLRETQVLELATQLSPEGKRALLRALIPDVARFEGLVDYDSARIRALSGEALTGIASARRNAKGSSMTCSTRVTSG
jgi:hypothetical protein